ncbi:hypothetical protein [Phocaeicola coprophilus]|uniref:hypothetical protein n=1 Tax=Phocaeicola coprophilus TaxID=387090 RepID=UPI0026DD9F82|nr:hypothetical protein [Phocaeicola coprophilus]
MVTLKKLTAFIVLSLCVLFVSAQDIKVLSSGQGTTEDEATKIALRSALEDAFGTFISSSTKIENDVLVSDEIVSLTQGNIKEYNVLNSSLLENGMYSILVESVVSLNKLSSYCESKEMSVSFNGKAFNIELKKEEFNRKSEIKILKNLCIELLSMNPRIFDFELVHSEPMAVMNEMDAFFAGVKTSLPGELLDNFNTEIKTLVFPKLNSNYKVMNDLIETTLKAISLSKQETKTYNKLRLRYYEKSLHSDSKPLYFRDSKGFELFKKVYLKYRNLLVHNWIVVDGIKTNFEGLYTVRPSVMNDWNKKIEEFKKKGIVYSNVKRNESGYLGSKINTRYFPDIEAVKVDLYYSDEETNNLKSIKIEPFNPNGYEFIKKEIYNIISEFDDIK